jgi:hypothetical protein
VVVVGLEFGCMMLEQAISHVLHGKESINNKKHSLFRNPKFQTIY